MADTERPPRADIREINRGVIAGYRASGGRGEGVPEAIVLLTTTGSKTGNEHTTPVNVREDGDSLVVAGSKGGWATHPQWYKNIQANGKLTVEYLGDRYEAEAITVENGADRDRLFAMMAEVITGIYGYQDKCRDQRQIPIVRLKRKP